MDNDSNHTRKSFSCSVDQPHRSEGERAPPDGERANHQPYERAVVMKSGVGCQRQISAQAEAAEEGKERRKNRRRVAGMVKESQRQNGMRRSSLMPHKGGKQNDSGANKRSLYQSDLSLTEIDKRPHQATAACAGKKRAGKIESTDAMPNALVHSGDDEEPSHDGNRHGDQESPAP